MNCLGKERQGRTAFDLQGDGRAHAGRKSLQNYQVSPSGKLFYAKIIKYVTADKVMENR